jgi:hypothetical protein
MGMEVVRSSETSLNFYKNIRCHIPDDIGIKGKVVPVLN